MIRGAQPGTKVRVLGGDGKPRVAGRIEEWKTSDGIRKRIGSFDFAQCNTGKVVGRSCSGRYYKIAPDPPNYGTFNCQASDLERVKDAMDNVPRYTSWGCGLQSTVIGEMSARGDLPPSTVIHADAGWERKATHVVRDFYTARWRKMGLQVHILQTGDIQRDGTGRHIHMPFWTETGGHLRRECTRHYKVRPVRRKVRELLGFLPSTPPAPPPGSAITWLGFTTDEWSRVSPDRVQYVQKRYPLLVLRMHREDCVDWLRERGLPVPPKSACIGCPFRKASEWIAMRDTAPDEWREAIAFDERIRNNPLVRRRLGTHTDAIYVWRDRIPLAEVDLEEAAAREQDIGWQSAMFPHEAGW